MIAAKHAKRFQDDVKGRCKLMRDDINRDQVEKVDRIMNEVKKGVNRIGRPNKIDDNVLQKLYDGACLGLKNNALCLYSGISVSCFYEYMKKHPDIKDRIELLRNNPTILAMQSVNKGLTDRNKTERYKMSRWYLEKTDPEFSSKHDVSLDTSGSLSIESRSDALSAFLKRFESDQV